jgi:formyltetrahydrofolate hydrolase
LGTARGIGEAARPYRRIEIGHCLQDLLHRRKAGLLNIDIAAVISNHDDMRSFVE